MTEDLTRLFQGALEDGIVGQDASVLLSGDLGTVVIAGAAGTDVDTIEASDVMLITILVDRSSSIGYGNLEPAVRDGYNLLVDTFSRSRQVDSILMALWLFNDQATVIHSYVPVADATRLDAWNYRSAGGTSLYDSWLDALAANVAYAQRLRDAGTPCRSLVVVVTDGEDTMSRRKVSDCARLGRDLLASEQFILAFVGVGKEADFQKIAHRMGIPARCVHVQQQATQTGLRLAFELVSRSAIQASQGKILPGPQAGFFA